MSVCVGVGGWGRWRLALLDGAVREEHSDDYWLFWGFPGGSVAIFLTALGLRCFAQAFSSCGVSGGYPLLRCTGFALQWLPCGVF